MAIADSLLPEFDHEMATTRSLLSRVPEADLAWTPHQKSYPLGTLSLHLAHLPCWALHVLDATTLELDDPALAEMVKPKMPGTREDVLQEFDRNAKRARAALARATDAEYLAPWTLKKGGQAIFTLPRISSIRSFMMNHLIHHRGQLSVYLRLRDVPLPPIYGPTADEQ
jgi:uncharacterized damage-inducible protein DinB